MKLSVVIITYNEEHNIGRCIDSVQAVADEVVILDSGSTDQTLAICLQKGAVIYSHPFDGYGDQKNRALQHASNDFILSLDADEAPDARLTTAIASAKASEFPAGAYRMNRCTNYCGKWIRHGTWYPDAKIRLFDRRRYCWNSDPIHESVPALPDETPGHLAGDILHYSYNSIEEHVIQNNKFSTASAEMLFKRGKRIGPLKIILNPLWAFIRAYFIRLGMLDGFYGFVVAVNVGHLTFLKYVKLYQKQRSTSL